MCFFKCIFIYIFLSFHLSVCVIVCSVIFCFLIFVVIWATSLNDHWLFWSPVTVLHVVFLLSSICCLAQLAK